MKKPVNLKLWVTAFQYKTTTFVTEWLFSKILTEYIYDQVMDIADVPEFLHSLSWQETNKIIKNRLYFHWYEGRYDPENIDVSIWTDEGDYWNEIRSLCAKHVEERYWHLLHKIS